MNRSLILINLHSAVSELLRHGTEWKELIDSYEYAVSNNTWTKINKIVSFRAIDIVCDSRLPEDYVVLRRKTVVGNP